MQSLLIRLATAGDVLALAFHARMGYAGIGQMMYNFGGNDYGNRVLVRMMNR